jgi:hypothetical protein
MTDVHLSKLISQAHSLNGEARLLEPLLTWLMRTRRINSDSRVLVELPWFGRRIDLATITSTRRTTAYELKLTGLRRALEQASYNRLAFDRSYVVTGSNPRAENIELAAAHGIGIIVVRGDTVQMILRSPSSRSTSELRARLLEQLRTAKQVADV